MCSAWVVTPDWLKASSRRKSFVGERPFTVLRLTTGLKWGGAILQFYVGGPRLYHALTCGYIIISEEESYLLRDKQFESKYKVSLATAIQAAQRKPRSLFAGFSIYPTPRVQPPLDIVTKLINVAGGKVVNPAETRFYHLEVDLSVFGTCISPLDTSACRFFQAWMKLCNKATHHTLLF